MKRLKRFIEKLNEYLLIGEICIIAMPIMLFGKLLATLDFDRAAIVVFKVALNIATNACLYADEMKYKYSNEDIERFDFVFSQLRIMKDLFDQL